MDRPSWRIDMTTWRALPSSVILRNSNAMACRTRSSASFSIFPVGDQRNPAGRGIHNSPGADATASGLPPGRIAVYVQRGPNGIGLETRYPVGLEDLTSLWEKGRSNSLRPSWEDGSSGGPPTKRPRTFRSHNLQTAQPLVRFLL